MGNELISSRQIPRAVQFCVHICDVLSCFVMIVSFSHDVSVLQEACAKIDEDDGEENNILGWADFFGSITIL